MAIVLIIVSSALLAYTYVAYPVLIASLAALRERSETSDLSQNPFVSVILSAYNEEEHIRACLDSLLNQNYPHQFIEIIVGSDGSSDSTSKILSEFTAKYPLVKSFLFEKRRGKMSVLNDIVRKARGEILFFVDADMMLSKESIKNHAKHYSDMSIGGVAGIYRLISDSPTSVFNAENDYHSYEMSLRKNESTVSSTVGLSGGNYSIRKELWRELPSDQIHDDLYSVFSILSSGKRLIFEPKAVSTENFIRTIGEEFRRKARFASRGFETVKYFPKLLSPLSGFSALAIWSHKILRWLSPFFLLIIFISTVLAAFYHLWGYVETLLYIELVLVCIALVGGLLNVLKISLPIFRHLFWFLAMNVAFILGTIRYLFRLDKKHWSIAQRSVYSETPSIAPNKEAHV